MARHFLNDHKFESEIEKTIWSYHIEGLTVRAISATLKKVNIQVPKSSVGRTITKLEKIMKGLYLST